MSDPVRGPAVPAAWEPPLLVLRYIELYTDTAHFLLAERQHTRRGMKVAAQLGRLIVLGAVWGCLGAVFVVAIAVSIRYRLHEPMEERLIDRISEEIQQSKPSDASEFDAERERSQRVRRGQATRLMPSHFGRGAPQAGQPPAREGATSIAPPPGTEGAASAAQPTAPPAAGGDEGSDR